MGHLVERYKENAWEMEKGVWKPGEKHEHRGEGTNPLIEYVVSVRRPRQAYLPIGLTNEKQTCHANGVSINSNQQNFKCLIKL